MFDVAVATTPKASLCSYLLFRSQYGVQCLCACSIYLYDLTMMCH